MKKLLLSMCLAVVAGTSFGYDFKKWVGPMFYMMSPDGKYLVHTAGMGDVMLYNVADSNYVYFEADETGETNAYYSVGMGNAINAQGTLVGAIDNYTPGFLQNGVWSTLPIPEGVNGTYTQGNGITADGKYICGSISVGSWSDENAGTTYLPVVWTRNDNGTYDVCEILPHPEKDFAGAAPQYVTAISISNDGTVVAGQVMSGTGFACYPIVYKKDADGKWSYTLPGLSKVVKEGYEGKIPQRPSSYPDYVNAGDYLTEEELAQYTAAQAAYSDSISQAKQGLCDYPSYYPEKIDFLKTNVAEYNAAALKYNAAVEAYEDSVAAYEEAYYTYATGSSYVYNTISLSSNGKYLGQTLQMEDPNADPFDWMGGTLNVPVVLNLEDGTITEISSTNMTMCSVADDGMAVTGAPALEYTRSAYIVPAGTTEPIAFEKWASEKCPAFSSWAKENMNVNYYNYSYDDEGNETLISVPDSVFTGTMMCNADGTIFCTYFEDYWTEDETNAGMKSFLIDLTDPKNPSTGIVATRKAVATVKEAARYSVNGQKLAAPTKGLNIVKMSDGTVRKVVVK